MFSRKVLAFIEKSKPVIDFDWLEIRSLVKEIGGKIYFFGERLPLGVRRLTKGEVVLVFSNPRTTVYVSETTPMEWKYDVVQDNTGVRYYPIIKPLRIDGDQENVVYLNKRLRNVYERLVILKNVVELPIPSWMSASALNDWYNGDSLDTRVVFRSEVEDFLQPFIDECKKLIEETKK